MVRAFAGKDVLNETFDATEGDCGDYFFAGKEFMMEVSLCAMAVAGPHQARLGNFCGEGNSEKDLVVWQSRASTAAACRTGAEVRDRSQVNLQHFISPRP